jgi:type II secretory pathway component PulC
VNLKKLRLSTLTGALVLLDAVIAIAIVWRIVQGTQTAQLVATPPESIRHDLPLIALTPDSSDLNPIRDQALFYASRQFYVPPAPSAASAARPNPGYRLAGVFVMPQKPAVAVLTNASGVSRKVTRGDDLEGWRVQSVESGRVVLESAGQTIEITNGTAKTSLPSLNTALIGHATAVEPTGGTVQLGRAAPANRQAATVVSTVSNAARLYRPPGQ